jgi:hypothetical protein
MKIEESTVTFQFSNNMDDGEHLDAEAEANHGTARVRYEADGLK